MDKVCFTQYIPSNKCEIKGYTQVSQSQPAQNPIQPAKSQTNSDKPSSKNNNKTLNWTIGLGAAATLIALGVIVGRKGHLGDRVQELLGGVKKSVKESEPKPPKTPTGETQKPPIEREVNQGGDQPPINNEPPESPEPPIEREVNQGGDQPNPKELPQDATPPAQPNPHEQPPDAMPPAPHKPQEQPASGQNKPAHNNPPAQNVSETSPQKPTPFQRIKNFIKDPFGLKAKKAAKEKAERARLAQEAAERRERKRLEALAEKEAMKKRIKFYPNMGIKELEQHYAQHKNLEEREIIYKHIQKQRFALQNKMDEKYSRMSKQELLEELDKLQAVQSGDRDYDAVMMVKQHLKQKGHVFEDDLFEGYLPLDIKPIDGGIEKGQNGYRIVGSNPAYSDAPRDVAKLPDSITPNDVLIDQYGTFTDRGAYRVFSLKYGYSKFQNPNYVWYEKYPVKGWTVEHAYGQYEYHEGLPRNYHYFTNIIYNNGLSGWARPEGSFMFTIRGDIPAEKLQKIRNYFIESGIMRALKEPNRGETCCCGQYVEKTKILDKMIEAVCDIVNK